MDNRLDDMIHDIGEDSFRKARMYDILYSDKDASLYKGCTNFTRFLEVLKLFNLKTKSGCTNKSFTKLLELLEKSFQKVTICRTVVMKPRRYCIQWV